MALSLPVLQQTLHLLENEASLTNPRCLSRNGFVFELPKRGQWHFACLHVLTRPVTFRHSGERSLGKDRPGNSSTLRACNLNALPHLHRFHSIKLALLVLRAAPIQVTLGAAGLRLLPMFVTEPRALFPWLARRPHPLSLRAFLIGKAYIAGRRAE